MDQSSWRCIDYRIMEIIIEVANIVQIRTFPRLLSDIDHHLPTPIVSVSCSVWSGPFFWWLSERRSLPLAPLYTVEGILFVGKAGLHITTVCPNQGRHRVLVRPAQRSCGFRISPSVAHSFDPSQHLALHSSRVDFYHVIGHQHRVVAGAPAEFWYRAIQPCLKERPTPDHNVQMGTG